MQKEASYSTRSLWSDILVRRALLGFEFCDLAFQLDLPGDESFT